MISCWRIFLLEVLSLVRSKTLAMLLAASALWMLAAPSLVRGDGTAEGFRELCVRFSLGGVFALLVVSLLAAATGSLARERAARRLQLTLVRPVRGFAVVLAKGCALTLCGAVVLALAGGLLALRTGVADPCSHVLRPLLPSPRAEAEAMYETFMNDPETPAAVKKARRSTVLRLLENRARDHYQTIATNATAAWRFSLDAAAAERPLKVRLRFTNAFEMRDDVCGDFRLGAASGTVSNFTQAIALVPLSGRAGAGDAVRELEFANRGRNALMLRPRRDLELLADADSFGWNLLRAYAEMVAILALTVAFGLFLSSGLSRPVALFTAIVLLAVCEMSPSVVEQYPDELETKTSDRVGLAMARTVTEITHPVSALRPLSRLAANECLEPAEVARAVALDGLLLPLLLALLSGCILRRQPTP